MAKEVLRRREHSKGPIGVSGFPGQGSGNADLFQAERDWWRRHDMGTSGGVSGFPGRGSENTPTSLRELFGRELPPPTDSGGVSGFPGRGSDSARELTFQEQFGGRLPHPLPPK